jgi:prolyl-tRNA editing enzyme YbaK/EbsC (Cys-tRNA(Pro) deacylase)
MRIKLGSAGSGEVVTMSNVTDQLTKRLVPHEAIPHEQAYTSTDEALALGISADEVVKTIVLDTGSGHALAVIPGSRRLDIRAAERAVGDNSPATSARGIASSVSLLPG